MQAFFSTLIIIKKSREHVCRFLLRMEFGLASLSFWVAISLVLKVFTLDMFDAILIYFGISIVGMIITLAVSDFDKDVETLSLNIENITERHDALCRLEKLNLLLQRGSNDSEYDGATLRGFIDDHQNLCRDRECPIRFWNLYSTTDSFTDYFKKEIDKVKDYITAQYLKTIKVYPSDVELKISFIYYMMDYAGLRNIAFEQIYFLNSCKKNITESYWVYQASGELESQDIGNKQSEQASGGMILNHLVHERILSQLKSQLDNTATEYLFFLQTMMEDNPNIWKVDAYLKNVLTHIKDNALYWKKNLTILGSSSVAKELYGRYLKVVIDQNEEGNKLIAESIEKIEKMMEQYFCLEKIESNSPIQHFNRATVVLESNYEESANINNCNGEFCSLLGFTKEELVGSKIENIMCCKSTSFYVGIMTEANHGHKSNAQEFVFKKKNRFCICCVADYKLHEDKNGNPYLIIIITMPKRVFPTAEIIVNNLGKIIGSTSGCGGLFVLSDDIRFNGIGINNIDEVIDIDFNENFSALRRQKISKVNSKVELVESNDNNELRIEFHSVKNMISKETGYGAFIVRLWKDDQSKGGSGTNSEVSNIVREIYKKADVNDPFQFNLEKDMVIIGAFTKTYKRLMNNQSGGMSNPFEPLHSVLGNFFDHFDDWIGELKKNIIDTAFDVKDKKSYGEGISTKRLWNGMINDVYEEDDEDELNELREQENLGNIDKEDKNNKGNFSLRNESKEDARIIDKANAEISSKQRLRDVIKGKEMNIHIKCLLGVVVSSFLLIFAVYAYSIYSEYNTLAFIENIFHMRKTFAFNLNSMQNIASRVSLLKILLENRKYWGVEPDYSIDELQELTLESIKSEVSIVEDNNKLIYEFALKMYTSQETIDILNEKNVRIVKDTTVQNFSLLESYKQLISATLSIVDTSQFESFNNRLPEFTMVPYNLLNDIQVKSLLIFKSFENEETSILSISIYMQVLNFLVAAGLIILAILLFSIILLAFYISKERLVLTFYGFQTSDLDSMITRAEKFLGYLQVKNFDEGQNDEGDQDSNFYNEEDFLINQTGKLKRDESFEEILGGAKRRKKKGTLKTKAIPSILWILFIFSMIFVGFVYYIYSLQILKDKLMGFQEFLERTCELVSTMNFYKNAIIQRMDLPNTTILGKEIQSSIQSLEYQINNETDTFLNNIVKSLDLDAGFIDYYQKVFTGDICEYTVETGAAQLFSKVDCSRFMDALVTQGLNNFMMGYLKRMSQIKEFEEVISLEENKNKQFVELVRIPCEYDQESIDQYQRNMKCLLYHPTTIELSKKMIQRIGIGYSNYIQLCLSTLSDYVISKTVEEKQGSERKILTIAIIVILILSLVMLIIMMYIWRVGQDEMNLTQMFLYIPLEALKRNRFMLKYIGTQFRGTTRAD